MNIHSHNLQIQVALSKMAKNRKKWPITIDFGPFSLKNELFSIKNDQKLSKIGVKIQKNRF